MQSIPEQPSINPEASSIRHSATSAKSPEAELRNRMAAVMSLLPGLGHLYKGQVLVGGLIFFVVGPLVLALSLALAPFTFGLSLIIPVGFMLAVIGHAYQTPDRRTEVSKRFRTLERGGEVPVEKANSTE